MPTPLEDFDKIDFSKTAKQTTPLEDFDAILGSAETSTMGKMPISEQIGAAAKDVGNLATEFAGGAVGFLPGAGAEIGYGMFQAVRDKGKTPGPLSVITGNTGFDGQKWVTDELGTTRPTEEYAEYLKGLKGVTEERGEEAAIFGQAVAEVPTRLIKAISGLTQPLLRVGEDGKLEYQPRGVKEALWGIEEDDDLTPVETKGGKAIRDVVHKTLELFMLPGHKAEELVEWATWSPVLGAAVGTALELKTFHAGHQAGRRVLQGRAPEYGVGGELRRPGTLGVNERMRRVFEKKLSPEERIQAKQMAEALKESADAAEAKLGRVLTQEELTALWSEGLKDAANPEKFMADVDAVNPTKEYRQRRLNQAVMDAMEATAGTVPPGRGQFWESFREMEQRVREYKQDKKPENRAEVEGALRDLRNEVRAYEAESGQKVATGAYLDQIWGREPSKLSLDPQRVRDAAAQRRGEQKAERIQLDEVTKQEMGLKADGADELRIEGRLSDQPPEVLGQLAEELNAPGSGFKWVRFGSGEPIKVQKRLGEDLARRRAFELGLKRERPPQERARDIAQKREEFEALLTYRNQLYEAKGRRKDAPEIQAEIDRTREEVRRYLEEPGINELRPELKMPETRPERMTDEQLYSARRQEKMWEDERSGVKEEFQRRGLDEAALPMFRASLGAEFLAEPFYDLFKLLGLGKSPKAATLLARLKKSGVPEDILEATGWDRLLKGMKQDEKVTPEMLWREGKGTLDVTRERLSETEALQRMRDYEYEAYEMGGAQRQIRPLGEETKLSEVDAENRIGHQVWDEVEGDWGRITDVSPDGEVGVRYRSGREDYVVDPEKVTVGHPDFEPKYEQYTSDPSYLRRDRDTYTEDLYIEKPVKTEAAALRERQRELNQERSKITGKILKLSETEKKRLYEIDQELRQIDQGLSKSQDYIEPHYSGSMSGESLGRNVAGHVRRERGEVGDGTPVAILHEAQSKWLAQLNEKAKAEKAFKELGGEERLETVAQQSRELAKARQEAIKEKANALGDEYLKLQNESIRLWKASQALAPEYNTLKRVKARIDTLDVPRPAHGDGTMPLLVRDFVANAVKDGEAKEIHWAGPATQVETVGLSPVMAERYYGEGGLVAKQMKKEYGAKAEVVDAVETFREITKQEFNELKPDNSVFDSDGSRYVVIERPKGDTVLVRPGFRKSGHKNIRFEELFLEDVIPTWLKVPVTDKMRAQKSVYPKSVRPLTEALRENPNTLRASMGGEMLRSLFEEAERKGITIYDLLKGKYGFTAKEAEKIVRKGPPAKETIPYLKGDIINEAERMVRPDRGVVGPPIFKGQIEAIRERAADFVAGGFTWGKKTNAALREMGGDALVANTQYVLKQGEKLKTVGIEDGLKRLTEWVKRPKGERGLSPKELERIQTAQAFDEKLSAAAYKANGIKRLEWLSERETRALEEIRREQFDYLARVNEARKDMGVLPFDKSPDSLSMLRDLSVLATAEPSIWWMPEATIRAKIEQATFAASWVKLGMGKAPKSRIVEMGGRKVSLPIETNAAKAMEQLIRSAETAIHFVPKLNEVRTLVEHLAKEGALSWDAHDYLKRYVASAARGKPDYAFLEDALLPDTARLVRKGIDEAHRNIITYYLAGVTTSIINQSTSIFNTWLGADTVSIMKAIPKAFSRTEIKKAYAESNALPQRIGAIEQGFESGRNFRFERKPLQAYRLVQEGMMYPIKLVDSANAILGYMVGKEHAKRLGLEGKDAIRYADEFVDLTQASPSILDVPQVQRSGAGKIAFTLQTFALSNYNQWVMHALRKGDHLLGGEAAHTNFRVAKNMFKIAVGTAVIGKLFNDVLNIYSPIPSPFAEAEKAYRQTGSLYEAFVAHTVESLTVIPGLSGLAFGEEPGPPIMKQMERAIRNEAIPKAMEVLASGGSVSEALIEGATTMQGEAWMSFLGLPVRQAVKMKKRLAETDDPWTLITGTDYNKWEEGLGGGGGGSRGSRGGGRASGR